MSKKIRPIIVVFTLVVSLVIIFGMQYVIKTYRFEEPLKEKVLSINGIEGVRLVTGTDETKIYLTLGPEAEIQKIYEQVKVIASNAVKGNSTIEIENTASPNMEKLYQKMHFAIYEGIASGKFTTMATQLEEMVTTVGIDDYTLHVDNKYVYLKLVEADEVYVKVINRSNERMAYVDISKGGESQW